MDPSGKVSLVEFPIPPAWAGKKLSELNEPGQYWLTAITRLGSAEVVSTTAIGQEGDVLLFVAHVSALDALRARFDQGPEH
jgi:trk system potassium uptake protein TrkA